MPRRKADAIPACGGSARSTTSIKGFRGDLSPPAVAVRPEPPSGTHTERVDRPRAEFLTRPQHRRRKRGLIGRVGKVLRLQTESSAMPVSPPFLAAYGAVEEIAGIELCARLRGIHVERAAVGRLGHARRMRDRPITVAPPHHVAVVIAAR